MQWQAGMGGWLAARGAMRLAATLLLALAGTAPASTPPRAVSPPAATPADAAARGASPPLPASGYLWMPQLAPDGPMVVVVDLRAQRVHVYRNGVRIGLSRASTGRTGYATPPGVYTILEKQREHYSNLYDDAPMPFMQRLTWSGLALHAGQVPDYPASHGCVRLPHAFAERLFGVTRRGVTVIVTAAGPAPSWVWAAPFAGPLPDPPSPSRPGSAAPVTLVWSTRDRILVVMRDGHEIDRGEVAVAGTPWRGTRAYLLLEGDAAGAAPVDAAQRWLAIPLDAVDAGSGRLDPAHVAADPAFAARVRALLVPGTTLLVTDDAILAHGDRERPLLDAVADPSPPRH